MLSSGARYLYFTPLNYQDIDTLDKFFDEYLNLLKEYLPHENGLIESDVIIIFLMPDIKSNTPEEILINKPLYVETFDDVKNNSINELKEQYLRNVELGNIEDNTIIN